MYKNIGLLDCDSHNFPNIALMKISTWHKKQGDRTELFFPMKYYDKVYMSKVFTFTDDFTTCINADEIIKGGTGYDLKNKLPDEIEHQYPDYDLYNIKNIAYGFLTRGCPRHCSFCIVGDKEGLISNKVADLSEFWHGQKEIVLCDPNILACKNKLELLDQLIASKAWVDINQGFDIRFMNDEIIDKIKHLKLKMLHFAWDFMDQSDVIVKNLELFMKNTNFNYRKLRVYVLTNYDTTIEEDLYRIYKLKELGYDPFVMIYEKWKAPNEIKRLARWVNNKFVFRSCASFNDYK